jgi:hypothetical protein
MAKRLVPVPPDQYWRRPERCSLGVHGNGAADIVEQAAQHVVVGIAHAYPALAMEPASVGVPGGGRCASITH